MYQQLIINLTLIYFITEMSTSDLETKYKLNILELIKKE